MVALYVVHVHSPRLIRCEWLTSVLYRIAVYLALHDVLVVIISQINLAVSSY